MTTTAFQDYYETLGVPRTASEKEIRTAFRKLARQYHPDVAGGDKAKEELFKKVSEAYEVLGDPEKRKKYDELGPAWRDHEAWERAGRPGGPFGARGAGGAGAGGPQVEYRSVSPDELEEMFGTETPFSSFFYDMFGGPGRTGGRSRGRRGPARGADVEGETEITLEEAYRGTTRTIELSGTRGTRRVEVRIPAGITDGARVRAGGQGGEGSGGGGAGDLLVRVRIHPHDRFTREGATLRVRVEVPLDVALTGGEVAVPTLKGTRVALNVPAGTQNGARLRLRGLGMPHMRGEGHGDLIAEVDVRLPEKVTPEVRRLAEELRRLRTTG